MYTTRVIMANNLINGHILFIWLVDGSYITRCTNYRSVSLFNYELLITIVLTTLWPINRYCSHFLDSRSIVLFTLTSLSNDLEIWWSWSSNYSFPCVTSWSWHFSSVSTYFGLFLLVRYTRLKDWSRILRYSVIVREITESKCPHNNNQKFEQTIRNGNSVETLTRIASTSRSILERFITSLFPLRPEVVVLRNTVALSIRSSSIPSIIFLVISSF